MGMIRSKITVVDDLATVDDSTSAGSGDTTTTEGTNSDGSSSTTEGLEDYNNLLEVQIPTDEIAIAKVEDGIQKVEITVDKNGFTPAVAIVQAGLDTTWTINGIDIDSASSNILFPYYGAQLEVQEGENPISFIPDQDFDFFTSDATYYGYVKVVEDINSIDIEAIKKEISEYDPTAQDYSNFSGGAGAPSCH
jgi:plastocyanin domain-containing protein